MHGGLEIEQGRPVGQRRLQGIGIDTVAVDGHPHGPGPGLGEGGQGAGVTGILDDHGVAGAQPAGGGGGDGLLGPGRDHDLTGAAAQAPVAHPVGHQGT